MDTPGPIVTGTQRDKNNCLSGQWTGPAIRYQDTQPATPDSSGRNERATGADACYTSPIDLGGGTPTNTRIRPAGYDSSIYRNSHLIAASLGGSGIDLRNLVPLYTAANSPMMYNYIEAVVKEHVEAGERVYYDVVPEYAGPGPVPDGMYFYVGTSSGYQQSCSMANAQIPNIVCVGTGSYPWH
jgi:DNA/RNA non-specific endonuclease